MIEIYDEVGYIKNVLRDGLSEHWQRDVALLVKFYKLTDVKKSEAKEKIREKCMQASKRNINPIRYNPLIDYKIVNKIFDSAWKNTVPLREIHYIDISKEVLDWFLNLSELIIMTDEEESKERKKRPKVAITKHRPINWNRTKFLFTLYIWTRVQENYLAKPDIHYVNNYPQRFKKDANLTGAFNLQQERNLMFDLGMIDVNYALGIKTTFINKYDVFKIPITDENRIRIYSGEPSEGDLYNCGYWLQKQKMGFFVCEECNKEIANYSINNKGGRPRKLCKACAAKRDSKSGLKRGEANNPNRVCIDCGAPLVITSENDFKTIRCPECQRIRNNASKLAYKNKVREQKREIFTRKPRVSKPLKLLGLKHFSKKILKRIG